MAFVVNPLADAKEIERKKRFVLHQKKRKRRKSRSEINMAVHQRRFDPIPVFFYCRKKYTAEELLLLPFEPVLDRREEATGAKAVPLSEHFFVSLKSELFSAKYSAKTTKNSVQGIEFSGATTVADGEAKVRGSPRFCWLPLVLLLLLLLDENEQCDPSIQPTRFNGGKYLWNLVYLGRNYIGLGIMGALLDRSFFGLNRGN